MREWNEEAQTPCERKKNIGHHLNIFGLTSLQNLQASIHPKKFTFDGMENVDETSRDNM